MSIFVFLLGFLWISLQNSLYHATTTATSGLKFKEKKKSPAPPPHLKNNNKWVDYACFYSITIHSIKLIHFI